VELSQQVAELLSPRRVVDIGLYHGIGRGWSSISFPTQMYSWWNRNMVCTEHLTSVATESRDVTVTATAVLLVGPTEKSRVTLNQVDFTSSVLAESQSEAKIHCRTPMTTLVAISEGTPFSQPGFNKLDVQGDELEVLQGGPRLIESAEAVSLEVNPIDIKTGAPLFSEATGFMFDRTVRLNDFCTFMRRPYEPRSGR
jgi:FkbM family methyltransferase